MLNSSDMKIQPLFGDTFDVVKQSLLRWLASFGPWSVHPMFTEQAGAAEVSAYEAFLGATVISKEVLGYNTNRASYFACAQPCGSLFLDPDTGIRVEDKPRRWKNSPEEYLCSSELINLVKKRSPSALTLVFDKCIARGSECPDMKTKLAHLAKMGVSSFAYWAQASFLIAGLEQSLVERARAEIILQSHLPEMRILPVVHASNGNPES